MRSCVKSQTSCQWAWKFHCSTLVFTQLGFFSLCIFCCKKLSRTAAVLSSSRQCFFRQRKEMEKNLWCFHWCSLDLTPFPDFALKSILTICTGAHIFSKAFFFSHIGNRKEKEYLPSSLSSQGISRSDRGRISFTTCQSPGSGATCSGPSGKESLLLSLAFMLCYSVSTFRSFLAIQTSFFLFFWSKINVGKREVLWFGFLSIALGNLLRSPENNKFPTPWSLSWEEIEPWYLYCWDKLWKGNLGYIALNQLFFFFFFFP